MRIEMSDSVAELAAAMVRVQGSLPTIQKTHKADIPTTKGRMTYTYADLAAIWSQARRILSEHGFALIQPFRVDEHGAMLQTLLLHTSGQWISGEIPIPLDPADPRKVGAVVTYYRRYSLAAMIGAVTSDEDDDAAGALAYQPAPRAEMRPIRRPQAAQPPREPQRPQAPRPAPSPSQASTRAATATAPAAGERTRDLEASTSPSPSPSPSQPSAPETAPEATYVPTVQEMAGLVKAIKAANASTYPEWANSLLPAPTAGTVRALIEGEPQRAAQVYAALGRGQR